MSLKSPPEIETADEIDAPGKCALLTGTYLAVALDRPVKMILGNLTVFWIKS